MKCSKQVHQKHWKLAAKLHYFIFQKTLTFGAVTVRNWNMTVEVEFASSLPTGLLCVKRKIPDSVDPTLRHCTCVSRSCDANQQFWVVILFVFVSNLEGFELWNAHEQTAVAWSYLHQEEGVLNVRLQAIGVTWLITRWGGGGEQNRGGGVGGWIYEGFKLERGG
jgi:hypothetical protein